MTMGCDKQCLSEYIDGGLAEPARRRVEDHLSACGGCRAALEELREVCRMLKCLPREPLPPGFLQRLERRRRETPDSAPSSFLLPYPARMAAYAASAAVVMLVGYDAIRPKEPTIAPAPSPRAFEQASAVPMKTAKLAARRAAPAASYDAAGGLSGPAPVEKPEAGYASAAARLDAPVAAKALGGLSMMEKAAPEAPAPLTNEELHAALKKEEARLGIRKVFEQSRIAPDAVAFGGVRGSAASADATRLPAAAPTVEMAGATPGLLRRSAAAAARGAPLMDARTPETEEGAVIGSQEDLLRIWSLRAVPLPQPKVDFERESLLLVFAPAEITSIKEEGGRLIVRHKPALPPAPKRYAISPRSSVPVVFLRED